MTKTDSGKKNDKKKTKKKLSSRQLLRWSVAVGWLLACGLAALASCFSLVAELGLTAGLIVAAVVALVLPGALWFWMARALKKRKASPARRRWLALGTLNLVHIALVVFIVWLAFTPEQIVGNCVDAFSAGSGAATPPANDTPAAPDGGSSADSN